MPLIDLAFILKEQPGTINEKTLVLVCEFNKAVTAFRIDAVEQIHRVSWSMLVPLSSILSTKGSAILGSVHIKDREILVVDLEAIMAESMGHEETADAGSAAVASGLNLRLVMAEDSQFIRNSMLSTFAKAGITQVTALADGQAAWDHLQKVAAEAAGKHVGVRSMVDAVVTDIEMPRMDGLTFCRHIKETPGLKELPVIVYSSLINEQMAAKCREVKADFFASKPDILKVIQKVFEAHAAAPQPSVP